MEWKKMRSPALNAEGFTLIEMAVVMAVALILLSIAVPSFTAMITSQRVSGAANELQMDLMLARNEAIRKGGAIINGTKTITVESSSWSAGWRVMNGSVPVSERELPAGLAISGSTVTFTSTGRANPVSFSVTGETDVVRCVSVAAAGSVTIKKVGCS
jgi:type IV fimbrial biogenesis protein FimT